METGNKPRKRRSPKVRYFYLEDKLYKVLLINRSQDLVYTFCYTDAERKAFVWSDLKKRFQRALSTKEVAQIIGRHPDNIRKYVDEGNIPRPQQAYNFESGQKRRLWWSHQDVLNVHDYLSTVHMGRPRKDGIVVPWNLPSRAEVMAMLKDDVVLYVKTEDGEFAPVWKEHTW